MKNYEDKHALVTCTLAAVKVSGGGGGGGGGEGGGGNAEGIACAAEAEAEVFVGEIEGAVLGPPRGGVLQLEPGS